MFASVGFIGAGRITRIMLGGWKKAGLLPQQIGVFDIKPEAVERLQAEFPVITAATLAQVASADLVFGALHPPVMAGMLPDLATHLKEKSVFCSLAPKLKLAMLAEALGGFGRLVRMNPNAPSIIGQGFNPLAFGAGLPAEAQHAFLDLMRPLGQSPVVAEHLLESYAVITAMGPTYFGFQFAELEVLAESFGIETQAAREAIRTMLHGTVELLFASALPRAQALDLVPVRPLAAQEAEISAMLQREIGGIYAKLSS